MFGASIEELLDMFETIGFVKKVEKRDLRDEEDGEQQHLMEAELELLAEERIQLSLEEKKAKCELSKMRRIFEEEAVKPENSKVEGQTSKAGMEGIMKDNGIDFGAFQAGDIQGNVCRKLMSCGGDITNSMTEFLQSRPGFRDLVEDAGERAHQEVARNES